MGKVFHTALCKRIHFHHTDRKTIFKRKNTFHLTIIYIQLLYNDPSFINSIDVIIYVFQQQWYLPKKNVPSYVLMRFFNCKTSPATPPPPQSGAKTTPQRRELKETQKTQKLELKNSNKNNCMDISKIK